MINPKESNRKDFIDFVEAQSMKAPKNITNEVLSFVQKDLNPSHKIVFAKLFSIQAFIGVITLIFCPQFDLSLTNNYELFHFFHYKFGESICMMICGSIFIGTGAIFAATLLKSSEVRAIKESKVLYYLSLSILFLSSFMLIGSKVYLILAMYWLLGATLGGIIAFESSRYIRNRIQQA